VQTAAALIDPRLPLAALALGGAAAGLGLAWPGRPKLTGARPHSLWTAAGLVLVFAAVAPLGRWSLLPAGAALIYLALTDLRRFSLPWAGLLALALAASLDIALHPETAAERLSVGVVTGLFLFSIRHWSGKPPKLGLGDVLLAGLAAALVGWRVAAPMLALAAFAPLMLQRLQRREGPVPFGFWLSLAALPAIGAAALAT
jgi:prepilin signal peptidase PulO-like enzyme (type II secretory pathway)